MTQKKYILALDQGTTGSRAFLFDDRGAVAASAYQEFRQYFPKPGWVEHDADEIWQSCTNVIKKAIVKAKIKPHQIAAIGITNQRETTVIWDRRTSKPVYHAIVWQCRRTADICQQLKRYENKFSHKTGLVVDPYFSGTKIKWLLDHVPGLRLRGAKNDVCFGTIDSWLIWKLTGGNSHVTDFSNASRTLIYNIRDFAWDPELLQILDIPSEILPRVQPSGSMFGTTVGASARLPLPSGIPILAVLGDQQAALYGQGCYDVGSIKNTYGTGCFLMLNTGKNLIHSRKGLLTTIASDVEGQPVYALEGAVFIAGAVIQWLRDQLQVIKHSSDSEKFIKGITDTSGVYFVPAFTGLGAPYWDSQARGIISGLTRGANVKHIVRAALESIAYQTKDVFDAMQSELRESIPELKVDGGASNNHFLMQFQADILNCKIIRPQMTESTAFGVAQLAGMKAGIWKGRKDLQRMQKAALTFKPKMKDQERKELYSGWLKAIQQAKTH